MIADFQGLIEKILGKAFDDDRPDFALKEVYSTINCLREQGNDCTFADFEYYLIHESRLNKTQEMLLRAKIAGKRVPRATYQALFPVGSDQTYVGSVIVTGHKSPDIDTTVASFLGWLDAFCAKVGTSLHRWNVPNDPTVITETKLLFLDRFGPNFFKIFSQNRENLTLTAFDLATRQGLFIKTITDSSIAFEPHLGQHAYAIINHEKQFVGHFRPEDVDEVRSVIDSLNHCLRYAQNEIFSALVSKLGSYEAFIMLPIAEFEPVINNTPRQRSYLDCYLKEVLEQEKGIQTTVEELMRGLNVGFELLKEAKDKSESLEILFEIVSQSFGQARALMDTFEIALKVKEKVLNIPSLVLHPDATIDEIEIKMKESSQLLVVKEGRPLGVIYSSMLRKPILGYVCFRDFCNDTEIGRPSYLGVLSVLDHHKMHLATSSIANVLSMDAQSSNCLVANCAFLINDQFPLSHYTKEKVDEMLKLAMEDLESETSLRLLQRVLTLKLADRKKGGWISSERAYFEYLLCLYAAIDDTDLLEKNTPYDQKIFVELINRLASIEQKNEVEVASLEGAKPLIQNEHLYAYYAKVYQLKEEEINQRIKAHSIFHDTKWQGKAMIGQIKIYPKNVETYLHHRTFLLEKWEKGLESAPLKMMMVTTLHGANDLYKGESVAYKHLDELWITSQNTNEGDSQVAFFLTTFSEAKKDFAFIIEAHPRYHKLLQGCFLLIKKIVPLQDDYIILRYAATTIPSRKKDISPFIKG